MNLLRLAAVALLGAVASAQVKSAPVVRRQAMVRVVDAQGSPKAGVQVTFVGGAAQFVADVRPVDLVRVASDERGRATARLLGGTCYVAMVCEVLPGGDNALIAGPIGYLAANATLDLACREEPVLVLPVRGAGAWTDLGPLRYFLVTPHPGVANELVPDGDGALRVPPMPECDLDVRTAGGEVLWSRPIGGLGAGDALVIPPPADVRVVVTDDRGLPVAGARIRQRVVRRAVWRFDPGGGVVETIFRTVGATKEDGRATVRVPFDGDPLRDVGAGEMLLYVDAPGQPALAGGCFARAIFVDSAKDEKFAGNELPFRLARAEPLRVPPGIVPAGTAAQLVATCKLRIRSNSYMHDARSYVAIAGADGALVFEGVPEDVHSLRLSLLLDEDGVQVPYTLVGESGRHLPAELQQEGSPLRLACGELVVRVIDGRGSPARGTVVCALPTTGSAVQQREAMVRMPLDGAGHARARMGLGSWILVAMTATGVCASPVVLTADHPQQDVEMRLEPVGLMRVQLLDDMGVPVAGAQLRLRGTRAIATGDGMQVAHRYFTQQMRVRWDTLRTDADGNLELSVVAAEHYGFDFALEKGDRASDRFTLGANDKPLVLRLK